MARKYYFRSVDGSVIGPYNLNVVAEFIRSQKVKANTPVSLDGKDFQPTKTFPELAVLLAVDVEGMAPPEELDDVLVRESISTYSGSLSEVSWPKVLCHFILARASGRLRVSNPPIYKDFYFENGKIVAASSNLKRDQLGQHLERAGVFDGQRLAELLQQARQKRQRLGDFLIQEKLLQPHQLYQMLLKQLEEKLFEVFQWRGGNYAFFPEERYQGALLPLNQNPLELVLEGTRRGYQLAELEALFQPYMEHVLLPVASPPLSANQLVLQPLENKLLRELENRRTIGQLLVQLGGDPEKRRTVLAAIYLFVELGLASIGPPEEVPLQGESAAEEDWEMGVGLEQMPSNQQSAIKTTPPVSDQERQLLEKLAQLKEQDFFARLGLERNAGSSDVAKAFVREARKYHPDQLPPDTPENIRNLSSQVFSLLNEAQQKLADDRSRQSYLEALEAGLSEEKVDVSRILEAEAAFEAGKKMLAARKFRQALEAFEKAASLNPEEGEFLVYQGFARFMSQGGNDKQLARQCEQLIEAGLKRREGNLASAYYFMGLIKKQTGDIETAKKMFKKALSLDGKLAEARSELRVLEMREEKKGGLFRR